MRGRVPGIEMGALLISLPGEDFVTSYLEYINNDDERNEYNIEAPHLNLVLDTRAPDWHKVITSCIANALPGGRNDLVELALYNILDVMDLVVAEIDSQKTYLYEARFGDASGQYVFFQLPSNEYLVFSCLNYEPARQNESV